MLCFFLQISNAIDKFVSVTRVHAKKKEKKPELIVLSNIRKFLSSPAGELSSLKVL